MTYKYQYLDSTAPEHAAIRAWEEGLHVEYWWQDIPPAVLDEMIRHVTIGDPTGGFVQACLEDRLVEAFLRADPDSTAAMKQICQWLYDCCPSQARGNPSVVLAWRIQGGLLGAGYAIEARKAGATEHQIAAARKGCEVCGRPVHLTGGRLVNCQHESAVLLAMELRTAIGTMARRAEP